MPEKALSINNNFIHVKKTVSKENGLWVIEPFATLIVSSENRYTKTQTQNTKHKTRTLVPIHHS